MSGSMARMAEPFSASAATRNAPANVAPEVMPTKIPSFVASSLLQRIASGPGMGKMRSMTLMATASPVSLGMKSGVQPCRGCGLKLGCGLAGVPSGFRTCSIPLPSSWASSGSHTMILVSARRP